MDRTSYTMDGGKFFFFFQKYIKALPPSSSGSSGTILLVHMHSEEAKVSKLAACLEVVDDAQSGFPAFSARSLSRLSVVVPVQNFHLIFCCHCSKLLAFYFFLRKSRRCCRLALSLCPPTGLGSLAVSSKQFLALLSVVVAVLCWISRALNSTLACAHRIHVCK